MPLTIRVVSHWARGPCRWRPCTARAWWRCVRPGEWWAGGRDPQSPGAPVRADLPTPCWWLCSRQPSILSAWGYIETYCFSFFVSKHLTWLSHIIFFSMHSILMNCNSYHFLLHALNMKSHTILFAMHLTWLFHSIFFSMHSILIKSYHFLLNAFSTD